jgi:hypothetical protein
MTEMQEQVTTESICKTPFSSYIIVDQDEILYFTQSFAEINDLNASQSFLSLSNLVDQNIQFSVPEDLHPIYKVYAGNQDHKSIKSYQRLWSEDLIHELRTASLFIELGSKLPTETSVNVSPEYLYKTLRKASNQQKVCALIASDFVELLSTDPEISPISLSKIISRSWESQQDPSRVRFNICVSSEKSKQYFNPNPVFYGNENSLSNFFKTILTWFENEQITIELEQENQISMRLSVNIPFSKHLSAFLNYRLVNHYLVYISAFYNLRCWITQSSLNIVFPLLLR